MFSAVLSTDPGQLMLLAIGIVLFLKKVAEMDRYHVLRVVVLTVILSCIVIYFFLEIGLTLGDPYSFDDCIEFRSSQRFESHRVNKEVDSISTETCYRPKSRFLSPYMATRDM
jgi:hypothetical protein